MMEKERKPEIRFDGYFDSWEQRKLGDLMNVGSVKRIHQSDWTSVGIRFLRARDIVSAAKNEDPSEYLYISEERYREYSAHSGRVQKGDMLVTGVGTIGVPLLITNNIDIYFKDGNIIWFKNGDTINGEFFYYSFISDRIQAFIRESAGIGTVGTYTIDSGKKTPVRLPKEREQEKIGIFFKQLDNLITLHQRKCEKLVSVKKSMLEKMFPKTGSDVPELRFTGFTDPWEQRELGDIVDRVVRKNKNLESTLPLTISAQYGLVDQITYFNNRVASKDVSNYFLLKKGEFAYNKSYSFDYPWGAIKRLDNYEMGVLSTLYIIFKPIQTSVNSDFLVSYYDTDNWHKGVAEKAAEGARNHGLLNISADDFFENKLKIPKNQIEQKQIGAFFKQLDNLITLHQRELEKLKNIKKSMLGKMFV